MCKNCASVDKNDQNYSLWPPYGPREMIIANVRKYCSASFHGQLQKSSQSHNRDIIVILHFNPSYVWEMIMKNDYDVMIIYDDLWWFVMICIYTIKCDCAVLYKKYVKKKEMLK